MEGDAADLKISRREIETLLNVSVIAVGDGESTVVRGRSAVVRRPARVREGGWVISGRPGGAKSNPVPGESGVSGRRVRFPVGAGKAEQPPVNAHSSESNAF